jgi:hypothetical protein
VEFFEEEWSFARRSGVLRGGTEFCQRCGLSLEGGGGLCQGTPVGLTT